MNRMTDRKLSFKKQWTIETKDKKKKIVQKMKKKERVILV